MVVHSEAYPKAEASPKIAIIGAGPCGITAAKNFIQAGLTNLTVFEKSTQLGGNWVYDERSQHSSIYETTHIISSKYMSQFDDFIMPPGYSEYPSHGKILHYFKTYADHFNVHPYIHFNTIVLQAIRGPSQKWQIVYQTPHGTYKKIFDYLIVANGHHWDPVMPVYTGQFEGEVIHSHHYKKASPFKNKRVLVIGGGNSACDIAVEIARIAGPACISMRRGHHIFPKFILGKPADIALERLKWLPFPIKQAISSFTVRLIQGKYSKYHLQKPTTKALEVHPTINSELLYYIRHGKILPYPGIERLDGKTVYFVDGRQHDFDCIIFATGYQVSFPFFSKSFIDYSKLDFIPLYRKMMHPEYDNLYFIGLFQPQGCIWPLADYQARIAALIIKGALNRPANIEQLINKEREKSKKHFKNNARHALEVDYAIFRKQLQKELKKAKKSTLV